MFAFFVYAFYGGVGEVVVGLVGVVAFVVYRGEGDKVVEFGVCFSGYFVGV